MKKNNRFCDADLKKKKKKKKMYQQKASNLISAALSVMKCSCMYEINN